MNRSGLENPGRRDGGSLYNSLLRRAPGVLMLLRYNREWLRFDLGAGLVLTTMLVPVGVAYAQASGLPGIHGLYATILPLVVYGVLGPSRILVLGPDSALAPIIAAIIIPLAQGDAPRAVALAGMMAIVAGLVCIAAGVARLGFITELLSKPIRYGYMNGIAVTVLISQLPTLFGFSNNGSNPPERLWTFGSNVLHGATNWASLLLGVTALASIFLMKRRPRVPGILLAVVGATIATILFDLEQRAGIAVLGAMPVGLPSFTLPMITLGDLTPVLLGGVTVALVAFADTSVLSRTFAAKSGDKVDPNQEMIALGAANLATGFFQGFAISSSSSRTPVAEAAGARTQVTGIVGACAIVLLLIFAPNLLANVPNTALAAVVIASALGLVQIADLRRIHRIQPWEFWLSVACTAGVVVFGAIQGIGLAIVLAVIEFLWDGWRPHSAVLGRVDGVKGYHDITRYDLARQIPGLVLFRWDAPLFFANAEYFRERIVDAVDASPTPVRWIVVAAEPVTSVDVTAADMLADLDDLLHASGVDLRFAEMKDPVKDKLKRFGLFMRLDSDHFFATLGEAVGVYVETFEVDWVDWQDRQDRQL